MNEVTRLRTTAACEKILAIALARYREGRDTKRDEIRAKHCWEKKVKPLMEMVAANKPPRGCIDWPMTEGERRDVLQVLESHCRLCGMCRR
jgi:hypothetical protein